MPGGEVAPSATHVNANGDVLPPPPPVDQPGLVALWQGPEFWFVKLPLGTWLLKSKAVVGGGPAAPTLFSAQRAASHLSERVHLVLVNPVFVWWERLSCWSAPVFLMRVAFFWGECLSYLGMP